MLPPKGVYLPIWKLHSIAPAAHLLADNITQAKFVAVKNELDTYQIFISRNNLKLWYYLVINQEDKKDNWNTNCLELCLFNGDKNCSIVLKLNQFLSHEKNFNRSLVVENVGIL